MERWLKIALIFIFAFVFVICLIIALFPRCREKWRPRRQHIHKECHKETGAPTKIVVTGLRGTSKGEHMILPAVNVSYCPISVEFNKPSCNSITIPKSGRYMIAYTVRLMWAAEATVCISVRSQGSESTLVNEIEGLSFSATMSCPGSYVVSHQYPATLCRGDKLHLMLQSCEPDVICMPQTTPAQTLCSTHSGQQQCGTDTVATIVVSEV